MTAVSFVRSWATSLAAAAAIALGGASAAGAVVVTFDNAPGNAGTYEEAGFRFEPINSTSGNCYDGRCLLEFSQGSVTTMTTVSGLAFNLESFYFYLNGRAGGNNRITVTDWSSGSAGTSLDFVLGSTWNGPLPGTPEVRNANSNALAGALSHNTGYFAFLGDTFEGVTDIRFGAHTSGQVRLDDVSASVIPIPAPLFLLLGGLGGLGLVARRRKLAQA